MKKVIWTLLVNDYAPEITQMTFPLIKRWAHKIRAEFNIISERKFPDWPVTIEKTQIYELGKENDWNIFVDADICIHPDMFDITDHLAKDTVLHNATDMAGHRWRYDRFFRRDGRHIGSCNWFAVAPKDCIDLWKPLDDLTPQEAIANIFPVQAERVTGCTETSHLIDDYTLSRNIAKFGLKVTTLNDILKKLNCGSGWLWHLYNIPEEEKVRKIYELLTLPPPPAEYARAGEKYGWGIMTGDAAVLKQLYARELEMRGDRIAVGMPQQGEPPKII